ncbi:chitin-binding protein [Kibdelosporangium banguiense]|uniref:Chitin-binding protein n=1 Tax=Kibdelosporangium banguiense TaxID=1365924 RepID=A0ABS4TR26_9PSEU|nr:lytic polysaccharide monooxygenase [Kibdelosporangium banguiense]MBP2326860.1 chitin-binding protein [Kibdelosporangium banguiense]
MRTRKLALLSALAVALSTVVVVLAGSSTTASAHGAMLQPGSRTYFCWRDGMTPQGNLVPRNPACAAAAAKSGVNPLYNWFSVLRSDGEGRTRGFVPDGQLCSGGNQTFDGWNLPSNNWPLTHLTTGADFSWSYNAWAAHPGWFYLYITKDSWSPTRALTWNDIEEQPFLSVDHPPMSGSVGSVEGHYYWNGRLPAGKSGKHIIYSVWKRSDSKETFYGCSDVIFDGGKGEVTGIGESGPPPNDPPVPGACTAEYRVTGNWNGGFQAEVTVRNPGTTAINGWTASWALAAGQQINSIWNGTRVGTGSPVSVRNVDWNRTLQPGSQTTFGLSANTSGGSQPGGTLTCSSP